jgi:hypothetical protein
MGGKFQIALIQMLDCREHGKTLLVAHRDQLVDQKLRTAGELYEFMVDRSAGHRPASSGNPPGNRFYSGT